MDEKFTGLNVLNEMGGGPSAAAIVLAVMYALMAAGCLFYAFKLSAERETFFATGITALAILCGAASVLWFADRIEPIRYEVTVQPGHVIDAARWEIVEQRGEIYVIEEREVAE
ncbi:hypothetical protein M6D81_11445 [Paenibacillus sp. J5C_2022]|uniref:hypothetical protein n=1 Tax=Paenibacillus sp. J5C2022 TaxID=2977129 RepID=UPI0021D0D76D|nr:hypothetical protein [Paenibacillus sp. J5C2022]MCU6709321.1 hypothetical protein [Paenibacillus sp. J5C2022]